MENILKKTHQNPFKYKKLRPLRKVTGMTQIEVSMYLFKAPHQYRNYENGKACPNEINEHKMCDFYKVHKNYFRED